MHEALLVFFLRMQIVSHDIKSLSGVVPQQCYPDVFIVHRFVLRGNGTCSG